MKLSSGFEIVKVADEFLAVPVGEKATQFNGVVVLNEEAAFLLNNMKNDQTKEKMVLLLTNEYSINAEDASREIDLFVDKMIEMGLLT